MLTYGTYRVWDNRQVITEARDIELATYSPEVAPLSFENLKKKNPDTRAWLNLFGTTINEPVVQGKDNTEYLNLNALRESKVSGALFLDASNSSDFSDFNNIVYGHSMKADAKFGGLYKFGDKDYFDKHEHGNLYINGKNRGLEIFAFLEADAFDYSIYHVPVTSQSHKESYLKNIKEKAINYREINVSTNDHIVLMSTCAYYSGNERRVVVAKLTDKPFANNIVSKRHDSKFSIPITKFLDSLYAKPGIMFIWFVIIWIILFILFMILAHRRRSREELENSSNRD